MSSNIAQFYTTSAPGEHSMHVTTVSDGGIDLEVIVEKDGATSENGIELGIEVSLI